MMRRNTSTQGKGAMGCNCGGYHFLHRKGSRYCYEHPMAPQHHAERREACAA
jgi:hypothetical protein